MIHVHSFLGGHSSGTFQEIISAAKANELNFVVMTEHTEKDFDTSAMTLRGMHAGILFVNGSEVSADNGDRSLVVPSAAIKIIAYPQEIKNWEMSGVTGVEVFNVYTNARQINPVVAFFDVLWSRRSYPDLVFALYYDRPNENLSWWDHTLTRTRSTATAGNDAHANIGVSLRDSSGKMLLGIQLDPYEVSFRLVRMHVLIDRNKPLDEANLLEALRAGHCFIGFDFLGDPSGFSFTAESEGQRKIQGDEITLGADTRLKIRTPVAGQVKLYKNGGLMESEMGVTSKDYPVNERGVYRVEIYLPQLGGLAMGKPWIISNPIYVR